MATTAKLFLVLGSPGALAAVLLGAFGAHALKARARRRRARAVAHRGRVPLLPRTRPARRGCRRGAPSRLGAAQRVGLDDARRYRRLLRQPLRARALRPSLARRAHA